MLDEDQIAAASRTLHDHWRAGTKLAGLEPRLRPRSRAEAYAIQGKIETYSNAKLFGWKIAATSEAGQKHINVGGPLAGRIFTAISKRNVNIIAIAQGSSELTIAIVVRREGLESAVKAIHLECGLGG